MHNCMCISMMPADALHAVQSRRSALLLFCPSVSFHVEFSFNSVWCDKMHEVPILCTDSKLSDCAGHVRCASFAILPVRWQLIVNPSWWNALNWRIASQCKIEWLIWTDSTDNKRRISGNRNRIGITGPFFFSPWENRISLSQVFFCKSYRPIMLPIFPAFRWGHYDSIQPESCVNFRGMTGKNCLLQATGHLSAAAYNIAWQKLPATQYNNCLKKR